jgi:hypothetical protein
MAVAFIPLLLVVILFLIVPIVGLIVLQVYLSKMEKDWPGFILPGLCLGSSLMLVLILTFMLPDDGTVLIRILWMFVLGNIPTIAFYLIYKNVHKKQSSNKELDKMTIQDLS